MAAITQPERTGNFLVSEANGWRSRETVVAAAGLSVGAVLGRITASGEYARHDPVATNGTQTVAGVLFEATGTEKADRVAIVRDAEVFDKALVYAAGATPTQIAATNAGLAAIGIAIRTEK